MQEGYQSVRANMITVHCRKKIATQKTVALHNSNQNNFKFFFGCLFLLFNFGSYKFLLLKTLTNLQVTVKCVEQMDFYAQHWLLLMVLVERLFVLFCKCIFSSSFFFVLLFGERIWHWTFSCNDFLFVYNRWLIYFWRCFKHLLLAHTIFVLGNLHYYRYNFQYL